MNLQLINETYKLRIIQLLVAIQENLIHRGFPFGNIELQDIDENFAYGFAINDCASLDITISDVRHERMYENDGVQFRLDFYGMDGSRKASVCSIVIKDSSKVEDGFVAFVKKVVDGMDGMDGLVEKIVKAVVR